MFPTRSYKFRVLPPERVVSVIRGLDDEEVCVVGDAVRVADRVAVGGGVARARR